MKTLLKRLQEIRETLSHFDSADSSNIITAHTQVTQLIDDYINGNYKVNNGLDD